MQSNRNNMKKLIPLLGITSLALSGLTSYATAFNYNNGDILLDFSQNGAGSADFEVDIGSLANLTSEALAAGGTVVLSSGAVQGYTLAQLSGNFANYNNLSLSVFGTATGAGTGGADQDYFSKKRNTITIQNATPNDITASTANTGGNDVLGVLGYPSGTGILNYGGITANVAEIPFGDANSYTTKGNTALNAINNVNTIRNTTSASFASGSIVSDLFEYDGATSANKAVYEGDFTFNSDGSLDFTTSASAVPEPTSYGILAAGGLLALSLKNKFRRQQV